MIVMLVVMLRALPKVVQIAERHPVAVGVMTVVIVDQDRLGGKRAQHERG